MFFYYIFWLSVSLIWFVFAGYAHVQNNSNGGNWFWLCIVLSMCPIAAFVSKYSQNVGFDILLLNILIPFFLVIGTYMGGALDKFSTLNWVGIITMFVGILLFSWKK